MADNKKFKFFAIIIILTILLFCRIIFYSFQMSVFSKIAKKCDHGFGVSSAVAMSVIGILAMVASGVALYIWFLNCSEKKVRNSHHFGFHAGLYHHLNVAFSFSPNM